MTVAELHEILEDMPPDATVFLAFRADAGEEHGTELIAEIGAVSYDPAVGGVTIEEE